MNYIGLKFKGFQGQEMTVIKYMDQFKMYYVEEITKTGFKGNELMDDERIQFYLSKQEEILASDKKMQEINQQIKEREEKEKQEYENVYGYCDNMSPMQKAKVLKTLNKSMRHNNKTMTRKEFIYNLIQEGYTVRIIDKLQTSQKKVNLERIAYYKYDVPVIENKEGFYTITKTEYNFALYLLNKAA